MRHTSDSEVVVTTVVVKGPASRLQSEWQHQLITQAVLAGIARRPATPKREFPRIIYLFISLLLLAGAIFFLYLAVK